MALTLQVQWVPVMKTPLLYQQSSFILCNPSVQEFPSGEKWHAPNASLQGIGANLSAEQIHFPSQGEHTVMTACGMTGGSCLAKYPGRNGLGDLLTGDAASTFYQESEVTLPHPGSQAMVI